jgi:hypothetical protein
VEEGGEYDPKANYLSNSDPGKAFSGP